MFKKFINLSAVGLIATAFMFFTAAPQMRADDDRAHCQRAVERAESRLDHAIARNGERSREAEDRRRELNAQRHRCFEQYHQWWNGREHRWETEENFDRDEHRDHDEHHDDDRH